MLFGKKERIAVRGMSCGHCEQTVQDGLSGIAGVTKVKASHSKGEVSVYYKGDPPDGDAIRKQIVELGFEVA